MLGRHNLYLKFSALMTVVILLISIGLYAQYIYSRSMAQDSAKKIADLSVLALKNEIEGWLAGKTQVVHDAGNLVAFMRGQENTVLMQLKTVLKNNPEFSSLYFGGVDNRMINASGWQPPPGFDLRRRPWYVVALVQNKLVITEAFLNASGDDVIVTIAKPVYALDGTLLGVVGGDVSVRTVMRMVQTTKEPTGFAFLLDGNRKFLAQTVKRERSVEPVEDTATVNQAFQKLLDMVRTESTGVFPYRMDGRNGVVAIQHLSGTNWILGSFIPLEAFLKTDEQLKRAFIFTLGSTVALLMTMFFLVGRFVVSPLLVLDDNIGRVDVENSPAYRIPDVGSAEFGKLTKTFNDVLDKATYYLARMKETEQRYRSLMMQAYDAVFLFDLETLEIVEANAAFEKITGYCFPLEKPLYLLDLAAEEADDVRRFLDEMHTTGVLHPALRKIRTRDGGARLVERTGTRIEIGDRQYQLTTLRDVTQERQQQQQLHKDLSLAAHVQRALLPIIPHADCFRISTVFVPQGFVSGDLYYLKWDEQGMLLRGFLIDITGHGMATALQTAAVNVLLHQVMDLPSEVDLSQQLVWLNRRIPQYIDESTFAAAIGFELDFVDWELRYAAAGINHFLLNNEKIDVAGMYLGIREEEQFELNRRPIRAGDSVCFMTDGISDIFDRENGWGEVQAGQVCRLFDEGDETAKAQDDATAICIEVRT
jgi:PAS domain S-box-containing protein